ncbi:hypothetical protein BJ508DRAFT_326297 [Ascobolus immersus RN42]|uniref:Uncharacterized protein n=1 Tax=Ascobolus immersus RN42 TaxID=1160509 RepID=A0A3N4I7Z9_ASCIM|nr:hypothetical protein BJ508DRAFT_326297 [Ascobolus immersus RN42]
MNSHRLFQAARTKILRHSRARHPVTSCSVRFAPFRTTASHLRNLNEVHQELLDFAHSTPKHHYEHCPLCYHPTNDPLFDPFTPSLTTLYTQLHKLFPHLTTLTLKIPTDTTHPSLEQTNGAQTNNNNLCNDEPEAHHHHFRARCGDLQYTDADVSRTSEAECVANYLWRRTHEGSKAEMVFWKNGAYDEGLIWACRRLLEAGIIRKTWLRDPIVSTFRPARCRQSVFSKSDAELCTLTPGPRSYAEDSAHHRLARLQLPRLAPTLHKSARFTYSFALSAVKLRSGLFTALPTTTTRLSRTYCAISTIPRPNAPPLHHSAALLSATTAPITPLRSGLYYPSSRRLHSVPPTQLAKLIEHNSPLHHLHNHPRRRPNPRQSLNLDALPLPVDELYHQLVSLLPALATLANDGPRPVYSKKELEVEVGLVAEFIFVRRDYNGPAEVAFPGCERDENLLCVVRRLILGGRLRTITYIDWESGTAEPEDQWPADRVPDPKRHLFRPEDDGWFYRHVRTVQAQQREEALLPLSNPGVSEVKPSEEPDPNDTNDSAAAFAVDTCLLSGIITAVENRRKFIIIAPDDRKEIIFNPYISNHLVLQDNLSEFLDWPENPLRDSTIMLRHQKHNGWMHLDQYLSHFGLRFPNQDWVDQELVYRSLYQLFLDAQTEDYLKLKKQPRTELAMEGGYLRKMRTDIMCAIKATAETKDGFITRDKDFFLRCRKSLYRIGVKVYLVAYKEPGETGTIERVAETGVLQTKEMKG